MRLFDDCACPFRCSPCAAAGVPPVIAGLSEGLSAVTYSNLRLTPFPTVTAACGAVVVYRCTGCARPAPDVQHRKASYSGGAAMGRQPRTGSLRQETVGGPRWVT